MVATAEFRQLFPGYSSGNDARIRADFVVRGAEHEYVLRSARAGRRRAGLPLLEQVANLYEEFLVLG